MYKAIINSKNSAAGLTFTGKNSSSLARKCREHIKDNIQPGDNYVWRIFENGKIQPVIQGTFSRKSKNSN